MDTSLDTITVREMNFLKSNEVIFIIVVNMIMLCYFVVVYHHRLKEKLHSQLMDEFIASLEQLNSPELAWKVKD